MMYGESKFNSISIEMQFGYKPTHQTNTKLHCALINKTSN